MVFLEYTTPVVFKKKKKHPVGNRLILLNLHMQARLNLNSFSSLGFFPPVLQVGF